MVEHWVNTLSGVYWKRAILASSLRESADSIESGPIEPLWDAI
jgi:hypothetical protein